MLPNFYQADFMKKFILFCLFIVPLLFYLFLATGNYKFKPLFTHIQTPLSLNTLVADSLKTNLYPRLNNHVSILSFIGDDPEQSKNEFLNLNQIIYKRFGKANQFQIVIIAPEGSQEKIAQLKKEIGRYSDINQWKFIYSTPLKIKELYNSVYPETSLDSSLHSKYAFIIDKEGKLRGREKDEDSLKKMIGYDLTSISIVKNKMKDDINILYYQDERASKNSVSKRKI